MKYLIAFSAPAFASLAGMVGLKRPENATDWVIAIIIAIAAGLGGNTGLAINGKRDRKDG